MDLDNPQPVGYTWLVSANLQLNCENGSEHVTSGVTLFF